MTDYVYHVDTVATLEEIAQAMGFAGEDGRAIYAGPVAGGGSYFMTEPQTVYLPTGNTIPGPIGDVPEMAAEPGFWGRLRINGASDFIDGLRAVVAAQGALLDIYEYHPGPDRETPGIGWSVDGVTPAPEWVSNVAVIA